jgi:hypothetical protein
MVAISPLGLYGPSTIAGALRHSEFALGLGNPHEEFDPRGGQ